MSLRNRVSNHLSQKRPHATAWLAFVAIATSLGLAYAGVELTHLPLLSPAPKSALKSLQPHDAPEPREATDTPLPVNLYGFALNALLVPLLDDARPPRWTDAVLNLNCGSNTSVMVDGEPMVPGNPIPTRGFTVQWNMDSCVPFGLGVVELSGTVDLAVFPDKSKIRALVMPDHLQVESQLGRTLLRGPFYAEAFVEGTVINKGNPTKR